MSPATAYAAYRTAEITTLSQRDLIVKLYVGAEGFISLSAAEMEAGRRDRAIEANQKAKRIFVELLSTLDGARGGEVAQRLHALYAFFIGQLVEGTLRQDPAMLRALLPIIADLRSAWEAIPDELADAGGLAENQGHILNCRT
jgi:flagellar protein FliS